MTMTTHDAQAERYSQACSAPIETADLESVRRLEARLDALREQINFARQALALSETELDAITESLSGTTTKV